VRVAVVVIVDFVTCRTRACCRDLRQQLLSLSQVSVAVVAVAQVIADVAAIVVSFAAVAVVAYLPSE
jgi:hypothetical protein